MNQRQFFKIGEIRFYDLPLETQNLVLAIQKKSKKITFDRNKVIIFNQEDIITNLMMIMIILVPTLFLIYMSSDTRWDLRDLICGICAVCIPSYWIVPFMIKIIKNMVGPLNVGCYITDSYIIETHPRTIRVVPLYEIESVDIINNYELKKSGGKKYTGSNLQVMYLDHLEEFNIDTVLKAKGIQETIKNKINEIKQSILSGQNQFENNGDMFHDVQFQPIYSLLKKKSTNNKLLFLYKLLLALVLSSIICCIFWVKNNKEFYKTPADVTQVEFPENDVIYNSKDSNDDLSILVLENCKESDNLVIKIKSKSIFNNWAATAYINKKSSVIVRMPPGKYTIYKAEGTTWYGEKYLFGDYTEFSQIGSTFKISTGDWRTIQIGVKDGNLGETNLRPNSFKK